MLEMVARISEWSPLSYKQKKFAHACTVYNTQQYLTTAIVWCYKIAKFHVICSSFVIAFIYFFCVKDYFVIQFIKNSADLWRRRMVESPKKMLTD